MAVLYSSELEHALDSQEAVTAEDLQACFEIVPANITAACGAVEYAQLGQGPDVLIAHGGPGGYDQALVLGELFRKNGFRIVAPSRPGYLGTPLECGKSAEKQGDFMAALLDALDISKALVVCASGGGPAAYQIAQRHPEKVSALVVIDGISCKYSKGDDINKLEEWMYLSKPGQWLTGLFFKHFPAAVVRSFLQTESTLDKHEIGQRVREILADQGKFAFVDAMFRTMTTRFSERQTGADNDIAMGSAIDQLPLDKIRCPALIIHGDADNDVPARDAEYAHQSIAGSDLLWINHASHIGFWTAEDAYKVQKFTLDWMKGIAA